MLIVCLFILICMIFGFTKSFGDKNPAQLLAVSMLCLATLTILATRFKIIMFDDSMIIYEWKVAALLPAMVEYKNIKSIEAKSRFHVVIEHEKKSHVYVLNAYKFVDTYKKLNKLLKDVE